MRMRFTSSDFRYSIIFVGSLFLALILGISLISYYLQPHRTTPRSVSQNALSEIPDLSAPGGMDVFPPIPPEASIQYAILGSVEAITQEPATLLLDTLYGKRTVALVPQTQTLTQHWPTSADRETLTADELALFFTKTTPTQTKIQVNDTVIAQSIDNISGLDQFTASRIIIIK